MIKEKKSIYSKLPYGNFSNKKVPNMDSEIELDNKMSKIIITAYDRVFGTHLAKSVGTDYTLILSDPSITRVCSGDIMRVLIHKTKNADDSYVDKMKIKFDNTLPDAIYNTIMSTDAVLYKYLSSAGMKKFYYKKELLHKMYYYIGEYLDQDIVKSTLEIKNKNVKYETKNDKYVPMNDMLHSIFLVAFKKSLDRFTDMVNMEVLCELMEKYIRQTPKNRVLYPILKSKLNKFLNICYNSL